MPLAEVFDRAFNFNRVFRVDPIVIRPSQELCLTAIEESAQGGIGTLEDSIHSRNEEKIRRISEEHLIVKHDPASAAMKVATTPGLSSKV